MQYGFRSVELGVVLYASVCTHFDKVARMVAISAASLLTQRPGRKSNQTHSHGLHSPIREVEMRRIKCPVFSSSSFLRLLCT